MPWAGPGRRRFAGDARGTTAVEFALVAPLLFAVLFGIITFGVQYATRIALTYAAAEGGRAALAGLSDTERVSLAKAAAKKAMLAMTPLVDSDNASVNAWPTADGTHETITVTIGYSDTRFAALPFLPDLSSTAPVTVQFYVTDPTG